MIHFERSSRTGWISSLKMIPRHNGVEEDRVIGNLATH